MEIGTVIERGEEVWRRLRQQIDLGRVSFGSMEEGMIGSVKSGVCRSLWVQAKERMK